MPFGICVLAVILRLLYEYFETYNAESYARRQRWKDKNH